MFGAHIKKHCSAIESLLSFFFFLADLGLRCCESLVALRHVEPSFPDQGSNQHLLHSKEDSSPLDHQGSPWESLKTKKIQLVIYISWRDINAQLSFSKAPFTPPQFAPIHSYSRDFCMSKAPMPSPAPKYLPSFWVLYHERWFSLLYLVLFLVLQVLLPLILPVLHLRRSLSKLRQNSP